MRPKMRGVFEKRAKCVQGGGGSQKSPKKCVRTKYTLPKPNNILDYNHFHYNIIYRNKLLIVQKKRRSAILHT